MGENCTSACQTRDHNSWGECVRGKGLRILYANSAHGSDLTQQKAWDKNLDEYRALRKQGVQPAGTAPEQVLAAKAISDATGTAYQGA